eukprot:519661_1
MSSKRDKISSNGKIKRQKIKKSKTKSTPDPKACVSPDTCKPTPKPKSKRTKPKSDVLGTIPSKKISSKKHKKSKSEQIEMDKSLPKKKKKKKKKKTKALKSSSKLPSTESSKLHINGTIESKDKSKRKKATKPKRKRSIKNGNDNGSLSKELLSKGKADVIIIRKSPSSAKKLRKTSPKKHSKEIPQVHSMKRRHKYMVPPRPPISNRYNYGLPDRISIPRKKKKGKTNDSELIVPKKKKKKTSDKGKKKKKDKTTESPAKHKAKKKKMIPLAKTEKMRKRVKTKTKHKELYAIGDYVHIGPTKCGIIRYKGRLKNVKGIWYGVELLGKDTKGDCDGVFNGIRHFECPRISGIFVMYDVMNGKMNRDAIGTKIFKYQTENKIKKKRKKKSKKTEAIKAHQVIDKGEPKKVKKPKKKKKKKKMRPKTMDETPIEIKASSSSITDKTCTNSNTTGTTKHSDTPVLLLASSVCARKHAATKSEFNLRDVMDRGRKMNGTADSNHRRTRSLSITSDDRSWMTHRAESTSSGRIKHHMLQQKRLDLQHLIQTNSSKKKKKSIGALFTKHIVDAKAMKAKGIVGGQDGMVANVVNTKKLKDRLKNEEEAIRHAVDIVKDLGFLKHIKDNEIYSRIYIKRRGMDCDDDEKGQTADDYDLFDMNNIDILRSFHGKSRETLSKVICTAIVRIPKIEIVEMCNADINDAFVEMLVEYLNQYYMKRREAKITILSLQSNPIADRGMLSLSKLIRMNHGALNTVKLQNNRRDISTLVCQQICEALQQNEYIIKFEFQFRHYQWRDFRDKVVKRNAEKARIQRLEMKKFISI